MPSVLVLPKLLQAEGMQPVAELEGCFEAPWPPCAESLAGRGLILVLSFAVFASAAELPVADTLQGRHKLRAPGHAQCSVA